VQQKNFSKYSSVTTSSAAEEFRKIFFLGVGHDGCLLIWNFILMVNKLKNLNFEAFGGQWTIGPY
jgi:hypothetical protein